MTRKLINWMLVAAVFCGLGVTFLSCKDDDDNNESETTEETQEKDVAALTTKAEAFWSVVGQLTDATQLPEDWEKATFEPSYGTADPNNEFTRIVEVNTAEEAARLFSNLIDENLNGDISTYTYQKDALGTLTYNRSTDGQSVAVVDVSIRQMPHLNKIVYKTIEQLGQNTINNGDFDGGAYYRFGDVVKKYNDDGKIEYWICVRPAFSYERKGDSHWVTLSALPQKNLFHHKGSNKIDYYLPTNLGNNSTHEKNFAEMLYAILNPEQWKENIDANRNLDVFNGFMRENLSLHGVNFWKLVAQGWNDTMVLGHCFANLSMDQLRQSIADNGLTVLYDGFSWYTSISWTPTLYGRTYSGANLKTSRKVKYSKNVKDDVQLNMSDSYYLAFKRNSGFFGDDHPRWIIRHATGKDLGGHDNPKLPLDGVEEVFVFNKYYYAERNLNEDDETFESQRDTYHGYYLPGEIVKDPDGNRWICVQTATRYDNTINNYSYFISFDPRALRSGNDLLANLPSRNLALQMLYELQGRFANFLRNRQPGFNQQLFSSLKNNLGVDIDEFFPMHSYQAEEHHNHQVKIICGSALFNDSVNGTCIVRMLFDMSALEAAGGRDMRYTCYDQYVKDPNVNLPDRIMKFDDLFNKDIVEVYGKDYKWGDKPWIIPPYHTDLDVQFKDCVQRVQPITEKSMEQWYNTENFKFMSYADEKAGYNMYAEPVMIFAVKRVHDTGDVVTCFEDGTRMLKYKDIERDYYANGDGDWPVIWYPDISTTAVFINDKLESFGVENKK